MKTLTTLALGLILVSGSLLMKAQDNFTTDEARAYLTKDCYEVLTWQYPWGASTGIVLNVLSDDNYGQSGISEDQPAYGDLDNYSYSPTSPVPNELWKKYLEGINRCNTLIEKTVSGTAETDRLIAEAKFLRAFYYFDFVRLFGSVPLNTNAENEMTQSPVAEVYAFIESDLLAAISALPLKSALTASEVDRATKGAAQSLLGKVYIYEKKWTEAISQLSSVIESNEYSLLPNFSDLWNEANEHSSESIFEIAFYDGVMDWNGHNSSNMDVQFMGARGYLKDSTSAYLCGWGFCNVTENLYNLFVANNDNVRLRGSVYTKDELTKFGVFVLNEVSGYYNNKYAPRSAFAPKNIYGFSQNEIELRYADVLLLYAEAKYNLGEEQEALAKLNMVHERAQLSPISAAGTDLLNAIKQERRLELAFENNRFFDLVRWDDAESILGSLGYKAHNNVLPIPEFTLQFASSMRQNSGYTSSPTAVITENASNSIKLWPNPVSSVATISYSLKQAGNVTISVFSSDGRMVQNVILKNQTTGTNSYGFNVNGLQNGVYSLIVNSNNTNLRSKMSIIK